MSDFGDRVHARRKELGLTLRELASRAGCTAGFLCDVEKGKRRVGADLLLAIGVALGMSLDVLMSDLSESGKPGEAIAADLPGSLVKFGVDADVPFRHVLACYQLVRVLNHYRANDRKIDAAKFDWAKFHGRVKEWL
jgi:transcriptional regulator with XRE-family HTH domain